MSSVRVVAIVLIAAVVALVYLVTLGWPANEYLHADFAGFWVGSRMLLDGADPYDAVAFRAMHAQLGSHGLALNVPGAGYGYPLTAALLFAPFALLPFAVAAPLWLVLQVVLGGAALLSLARTLFPGTISRDRPVLLALAVAAQPVWVLAASGNVGGFLLVIAAAATALLLRGHAFAAGAVAGLLVAKPHPLFIAMILIVVGLPRRDALRAVAGAFATGVLVILVTLALRPGWVDGFLVSVNGLASAPIARASLFGALMSFGSLPWVLAALVVLTALAWERVARPPLPVLVAVAIPVSLAAVPYIWSYDHIVLLVSVAVIIAVASDRPATARLAILVLLVLAGVVLPWALYAVAFRRGDEAWSVAVPIAMLLVLAITMRSAVHVTAGPARDGYGTMTS